MATAQEMASEIGVTLPEDWENYAPEEKIEYFNEEGVTPKQLEAAGIDPADIAWMQSQGYNVANPPPAIDPSQSTLSPNFSQYVYDVLDRAQAAADLEYQPYEGTRFAGPSALQQQAFSGIANLGDPAAYNEALKTLTGAAKGLTSLSYTPGTFTLPEQATGVYQPTQFSTGLTPPRAATLPQALPQFPENWSKLGAEEKINWLNQNKVGIDTLRRFGVPAGDIASMLSMGYQPNYNPTAALPSDWEGYLPQEKIDWFNRNKVSPQQLRMYGVSDADIGWMQQNGYQVPSTADAGQNPVTRAIAEMPRSYGPTVAAPSGGISTLTAYEPAQYRTFGATPGWDAGAARQASSIDVTLPNAWGDYTPEQKIKYFNEKNITPDQLLKAGISQGDIDWMSSQGYGSGTAAQQAQASQIGLTLPTGWGAYNPEQKINYFNTQQITPDQLLKAGVGQGDIDWMAGQGYKGVQGFADGGIATLGAANTNDPYQLASVADYMSPYTSAVTDIGAREARRQADISRQAEQARLAQAGAYGGSRQAIMEAERQRNLMTQIGDITNTGLQSAYDRALAQRQAEATLGLESQKLGEQSRQFGASLGLQQGSLGLDAQKLAEQSRQFGANLGLQGLQNQLQAGQALAGLGTQQGQYGLNALNTMLGAGNVQQQQAQQPLDFGYQQWQESMKYPYQQATFMQSMLGGLPLAATPYSDGSSAFASGLQGLLAGLALTGGIK